MQQKKTAQELKRRHKARRLVNLTGGALSALNPAFKKVIKDLDKTDKKIRKEAEDLNYLIGMARSFARRRDYLTAATYLTKFHEKIRIIHHQLNAFDSDISKGNRKFLLQQFRGKDKKKLFEYDPNKEIESVKNEKLKSKAYSADDGLPSIDEELVSTAGAIKDWWRIPGRFTDLAHSLTDRKSRSMKALERSFSDSFFSQLKQDTKDMLEVSEELYKNLLGNFHRMGSAWATRNVGAYIQEIKDINESYSPYHKAYIKYYQANIVPMKEEQDKLDEEQRIQDEENRAKVQVAYPTLEAPPSPYSQSDPFKEALPSPKSFQPRKELSPSVYKSLDPLMEYELTKKKSHEDFLDKIEKLSSESEMIMEILNYSEEVEKYSEEDSLKLLAVAEGLIEKQAGIFDDIKKKIKTHLVPTVNDNDIEPPTLKNPESPVTKPATEVVIDRPMHSGIPATRPATKVVIEEPIKSRKDLTPQLMPKYTLEPIEHGIPEGRVDKKWSDIPFLANKRVEDIKLSSNAANLIINKIGKYLHHKYVPFKAIINFEHKLIDAFKKSIIKGHVVSNMACADEHNARDCQIEIFSYIRLEDIDSSPVFNNLVLSYTVTCRLTTFDGNLIIRTINNPKLQNAK